jgi:NitT/TauT family transport system permease protein
MKLKKANLITNIILTMITILAIFLIWFLASICVGEELILPSPVDAFSEVFNLFSTSVFWKALGGTISRSFLAFLISFIIATCLALLCKFNKYSKPVVSIIISILRAIPTIAVVLMLLLWTTSKVASIIVTMLVVLPTLFTSIMTALGEIDYDIIEMMNLYKVPKKRQFSRYIIPQITPSTIQIVGSGLSLNIKLMVAAEVIAGASNSIGQLMSQSKIYFETSSLFALVFIMVIIAVAIELGANIISKIIRGKNGSKKHN